MCEVLYVSLSLSLQPVFIHQRPFRTRRNTTSTGTATPPSWSSTVTSFVELSFTSRCLLSPSRDGATGRRLLSEWPKVKGHRHECRALFVFTPYLLGAWVWPLK